ncbi:MAG: translation initiation factor IF-2 N-terminal domain-containing protein, partial [Candidatus Thiodiazotropha sp. 6PDIVS]
MSEVTVAQLANVVGIPADLLMEQLADAGITARSPDDRISDEEKAKLLLHLRESHGKKKTATVAAPSKVTLRRKTVSELRQPTSSGRTMSRASAAPAKTVSVEVRKKRTYVKRANVESGDDKVQDAEEARKALDEQAKSIAAVEAEVEARKEAEETKRAEAEATQKALEEEEAKQAAEEEAKRLAQEEAVREAEEQAKREVEIQKAQAAPKPEPTPEPVAKAKPDAKSEPTRGKKGRKDSRRDDRGSHSDRKELHVAEGLRGKRKKKPGKQRRAAASASDAQHGFQRPTAPVVHEVKVPDSITVADLAQRMTIKAAEVIKVLMKMGMMVTINQTLDRDTATLVVEEMGHVPVVQREEDVEADLLSIDEEAQTQGDMVQRPP